MHVRQSSLQQDFMELDGRRLAHRHPLRPPRGQLNCGRATAASTNITVDHICYTYRWQLHILGFVEHQDCSSLAVGEAYSPATLSVERRLPVFMLVKNCDVSMRSIVARPVG
jgi:hypothetical protein